MTVACRFIPPDQFKALNEERTVKCRVEREKHPGLSWEEQCKIPEVLQYCHPNFFGVGAMWYASWIFDPEDPEDLERLPILLENARSGKGRMLSRFYLEQWALKRPPICVITPSMHEWCVDAGSTNGEGWTVTGEVPLITCAPSIVVPGYHGFLRNGVFTDPI